MATYLYSYGRRRHIADPTDAIPPASAYHLTVCGELHESEVDMRHRFISAYGHGVVAQRNINRKLTEPVCQRCAKKAAES